jgi:adenylate kinase
MRLVFLGAPGAGKGTQARGVAAELSVPQVATGDMLREAVAAGTELGREAKRYMDAGELVPDGVVIGLIADRLRRPDAGPGFILDGFPRTMEQAEGLDRLLAGMGQKLDRVLFFDVGEDELVRRLTGRRVCRECGATYHVVSAPPGVAGRCDRCQGDLVQRDDDREATVRSRLAVYARQTRPLLDHYRAQGVLVSIPGEGAIDRIRAAVRAAVGLPG